MGLTNINAMQQVNKSMFNNALQSTHEIDNTQQNLQFLNENYLKRLLKMSDSSTLDYTFKTIEESLTALKKIDKETAGSVVKTFNNDKISENIITDIKDIKELAYQPETRENYFEFEQKFFAISKELKNLKIAVEQNSYDLSTYSTINSRNAWNTSLILLIISTTIAIIIGLFINASISWPLKEIIFAARSLAAGDFTKDMPVLGCRETSDVVRELNNSLTILRRLIGDINNESEIIAQASNELKSAAFDSGKSAGEVARAMGELAIATFNQTEQINKTVGTVAKLGDIVCKVSLETTNIASVSEKVAGSAENGQKVSDDVMKEINELYLSTKEISDVIMELNHAMEEISEITREIGEISEQTTLLTLNASIEAARAGEHGKGFSVVAVETGKLAERSKRAAQMIADLTIQMRSRTEHATNVIEKGTSKAEEGKALAAEATVTFVGIFKELKEVVEQINKVALSTHEMLENNEIVINAVSNIAAISEESMASTEEVSATAEEQSAATQEVTALADNLSMISNEMKKATAVFKI
jgi:methyl-accepting chemotaxis protein